MGHAEPSGKAGEWRARWPIPGTMRTGSKSGFRSDVAARKYANRMEGVLLAAFEAQQASGGAGAPLLFLSPVPVPRVAALPEPAPVEQKPEKPPMTVGEWYAEWRPAQVYDSINTAQSYDRHWRRHIRPRWAEVPIEDILPIHIQGWEAELGTKFAHNTVNAIMTVLRNLLGDAQVNRVIKYSVLPSRNRTSRKKRRSTGSIGAVVPIETWEAIRARMRRRDAMLSLVVYWTGMRWSEACGMRSRFLTLTAATAKLPACGTYYLHPEEGAVHEDEAGNPVLGAPKSGPGREWDLPPFLVEELIAYQAWLKALPSLRALAGARAPKRKLGPVPQKFTDLLFPWGDGWPCPSGYWHSSIWRPACDGRPASADGTAQAWEPIWPKLRLHDGKHSHAAMMRDLGTDDAMRDDRLGHAIPGARGAYSQPTREMRERLMIGLQERWELYQAAASLEKISNSDPKDLLDLLEQSEHAA